MKYLYIILLSMLINSCIGVESINSGAAIKSYEPSYKSAYDNTCDLNYSNEPLWEISLNFEDQYGVMLDVPIDTMDLFIRLRGDEQEITQYLINLFVQHPHFKFAQEGQSDGLWIGLVGDKDLLTKITGLIGDRFQIEESKKGDGIRINLKGEQVHCWQAIGQIAQQSDLGIDYITLPELVQNNRKVLAYRKVSPFYLYVSKEMTTGKLFLDLLYDRKITTDVWDIHINNVCMQQNDEKQEIPGCTFTATDESSQCNEHVQWISDEPVQWEAGMTLQGVIQGPVLTREYQVENLRKNTSVKGDELEINVHTTAVDSVSELPSGLVFKPDEIDGEWVTVTINIMGDLNDKEKAFLHEVDQKRKEGNHLTQEETSQYEYLLKEKMTKIEVESLGKPKSSNDPDLPKYGGVYYSNTATGIDETKVMFDSIQDGKEIFPLNLELRKYEPKTIKFSITVE